MDQKDRTDRKDPGRGKGFLLTFAIVGVIVGGAFGYGGMSDLRWESTMETQGVRATGVITRQVGDSKGRYLEVRYTTATGDQVQAELSGRDWPKGVPWPQAGPTIPIVYNPENPTGDIRHADAEGRSGWAYFSIGLGVVTPLVVLGIVLYHWRRADRWAFRPVRERV